MGITKQEVEEWQLKTDQNGVEVWPAHPLGCRLNQGQGQRRLESMTPYQNSDFVNRCVFTRRTILPNCIPI